MTPRLMQDRRRSPRLPVRGSGELRISLTQPVRLLDISVAGALVAADVTLPIGARGRLIAPAPQGVLAIDFCVTRRLVQPVSSACTFAAAFVNTDEAGRRELEAFLRRGSE